MSLFKYQIIQDYDIKEYVGNNLKLECSKLSAVKAPFEGKLSDGVLSNGEYKLNISNVNFDKDGKVKAGDIIGRSNSNYILVSMKNKDVLKYLRGLDHDEIKKPVKHKEIVLEEEEKE